MSIVIRPLHPLFVGEVTGVDLSRPLSGEEVAAIEAGMDRHAVLLFRDQPLTDEQQMAFSRHFDKLENPHGGNIPRKDDDRRWQPSGARPMAKGNPQGMAGFVLANGSMSSNQSGVTAESLPSATRNKNAVEIKTSIKSNRGL